MSNRYHANNWRDHYIYIYLYFSSPTRIILSLQIYPVIFIAGSQRLNNNNSKIQRIGASRTKMFDSIFSETRSLIFFPLFYSIDRERESQTEFPHCTNNSFVLSVTWARAVGAEVCSRTRIGYRKLNWLNLTFGAADEHNGRWVFNGSSCISSLSPSPRFYRKPVAQLQCIRAHPCPGYSLYHFDTNLKFFSK